MMVNRDAAAGPVVDRELTDWQAPVRPRRRGAAREQAPTSAMWR